MSATRSMSFGDAIELVRTRNAKIQRAGWNGKGMHVYLLPPFSLPDPTGTGPTAFEGCLVLFTADRKHQPGWNASQPDLLATDWQVV